jgi:hypothetical protein
MFFSKYKNRKHRENFQLQLSKVMAIMSRNNSLHAEEDIVQMFSLRINHPLCKFKDFSEGSRKNEEIINQDIL